jgi:hypothetical protein
MQAVIATFIFVILMGAQIWSAYKEYKKNDKSGLTMGIRWTIMVATCIMFGYYVKTYLL